MEYKKIELNKVDTWNEMFKIMSLKNIGNFNGRFFLDKKNCLCFDFCLNEEMLNLNLDNLDFKNLSNIKINSNNLIIEELKKCACTCSSPNYESLDGLGTICYRCSRIEELEEENK